MNNRPRRVKEELPAASSSSLSGDPPPPRPMEGLHETGPPPFLTKTYEIIEDSATNDIVSWSRGNNSFVVDLERWIQTSGSLPMKVFLRGQKHLLKLIRRRKTPQSNASQQASDPCVEVGWFGLDEEMDRLRRDKQVLMAELVKLRQQQQTTKTYLERMENRLKKTETKQQLMMNFLARAIQSPDFIQHLIHHNHTHRELQEAINRKRRRHIDQGAQPPSFAEDDIHVDVDLLAHEEEETTAEKGDDVDECVESDRLDEGFWENLLNEASEEGFGFEDEQDDNGDELVHQFGFFNSSTPK